MLAIRLARVGAKKKPAYRVVVIEKSRARNSSSLEILGHYNPTKDPILLSLKRERIEYWISKGAQPSKTVERLMRYKPPEPGAVQEKPVDTPETIAADKSDPATEIKSDETSTEDESAAADTDETSTEDESAAADTDETSTEDESAAADTDETSTEDESAAKTEGAVAEDPKG